MHRPPTAWQVGFVLIGGVLAVATSAILIRLAIAATGIRGVGFSLVLAASRLTLAAMLLLPNWRRLVQARPTIKSLGYSAASGLCLALHFSTWITSLSYTSIVASTTLVTTNPVWVALLSWWWLGEKPSRLTSLGIGIALSGSLMLSLGGSSPAFAGNNPLLGNLLALAGSWAVSLYFLLGRAAQQQGLSLSHYITMAYSTAALLLLPLPPLVQGSYTGYSPIVYLYMLLMALVPQLIGHTSINWSMRWLSPAIVTLAILFEPVFASILGYFLFQEVPHPTVLLSAIVLLFGVGLAVVDQHNN